MTLCWLEKHDFGVIKT